MRFPHEYIALDIETPNSNADALSAIGIVKVQNGQVVKRYKRLINPESHFDDINIQIAGISPHDVENEPTFLELWGEIRAEIANSIIIGHNITYDLAIITKALRRYELEVPDFYYLCTLKLSKPLIQADSHKLSNLMNLLGHQYTSHDPLEDAEASAFLFEHLLHTYAPTEIQPTKYEYRGKSGKSTGSKRRITFGNRAATNINKLHGILAGVAADNTINQSEFSRLTSWIEENSNNMDDPTIAVVARELSLALSDGELTVEEFKKLYALTSPADNQDGYIDATKSMQVLFGILDGITSDNLINHVEIAYLELWLSSNSHLQGEYPYDHTLKLVSDLLYNGTFTEAELQNLLQECKALISPASLPTQAKHDAKTETLDSISGLSFCLTGDFQHGQRKDVSSQLTALGAIPKTGVSSRLDLLIIGSLGSEAWKYGVAGGKIAKARQLQQQGKNIRIITEDDIKHLLTYSE